MTIEIAEVPAGTQRNEFGVGVRVTTNIDQRPSENEGATFCGICMAINAYMHSRGTPDFDCLKVLQ